jgi:hypothetical protein
MILPNKHFWTAVFAGAFILASAQAHALTLWASDSQDGTHSKLYRFDVATGEVLNNLDGPGAFADALSFSNDGQSIFVSDSSVDGNNGQISNIWQIDLTGNVLNRFEVGLDAEGLTVLADGTLVVGGGTSGVVAFVDPNEGTITSAFNVRNDLYGMSSDGFGNIFGLTANGIIETYSLSGLLLNSLSTQAEGFTLGLAYTGDSFFVSSLTDMVYEIGLDGSLLGSFISPGPFTEGLDFPAIQTAPVPEPSTVILFALGIGIVGVATGGKQFFRKQRPSSVVQS